MEYGYDKEADGLYIWFVKDIEESKVVNFREIWPLEF